MTCQMFALWFVKVAKRSHDLWGGEEGLDREIKKRDKAREKKKRNQYSKQVKGT